MLKNEKLVKYAKKNLRPQKMRNREKKSFMIY